MPNVSAIVARTPRGGISARRAGSLALSALAAVLALEFGVAPRPADAAVVERAPLSTDGARIVDSAGERLVIQGVNWFGFETGVHVPHGLWARDYADMLAQIHDLGFNAIRLPFSIESISSGSISSVNTALGRNAELAGKTPLEAMDLIVAEARRQDLLVVLDLHSLGDDSFQHPLWYGNGYSEDDWVDAWRTMANRFGDDPNVVAADLKNEPHGEAQWGTGAPEDWRRAAERAGDAVHAITPHWLIVVEGVEGPVAGQTLDRHWWGGNLEGVRSSPVRLERQNKLVYSPHEYGPGVYAQPWFSDPNFQQILYERWQRGFDYIAEEQTAPILLGEFGGRQTGIDTVEGIWQRQLIDFIGRRGRSWTYWSWNPNSGDTGGILGDDWRTPVVEKLALLQQLQRREPIDFPGATPWPDPEPDPAPAPNPEPDPDPVSDPPPGSGDGEGVAPVDAEVGPGAADQGVPAVTQEPPDTRIVSGPPGRSRHRRVRFRFESESAEGFQCRIDRDARESCQSPAEYRLDRGWHIFRVRSIEDGAADPSPAKSRFKIASR